MGEILREVRKGAETTAVSVLKQTWMRVAEDFSGVTIKFPNGEQVTVRPVSEYQSIFSVLLEIWIDGKMYKEYDIDIGQGYFEGELSRYFYQSDPGQARALIQMALQAVADGE